MGEPAIRRRAVPVLHTRRDIHHIPRMKLLRRLSGFLIKPSRPLVLLAMDDDAPALDTAAGLASLTSFDLITSVASAKGKPHAPPQDRDCQEEKVDA